MRISDWSSDVCSSDLPPRIEIILVDIEPGATVAVADHARLARLRRRGPAQPGPAVGAVHAGGIGSASCRERVWQYVSLSWVSVSFKKKIATKKSQASAD